MSGFDKKRSGGQQDRSDYVREGMSRQRGRMWKDAVRAQSADWTAQARSAAQVWADASELVMVDFPPAHSRRCLPGGGGGADGGALAFARSCLDCSGESLRDPLDLYMCAAIFRTLSADDVLTFAELYTQRLGGKP